MQYTIKKGDTLKKIAREHKTTVKELAARNNIADPNRIYAGESLTIGGADAANTPANDPSGYDAFYQGLLGLAAPVYSPPDTSARYAFAEQSYKKALNSAYERQKSELEQRAKELLDEYEGVRKRAYANSRLGAIGENEALSSLGLSGNLYAEPRSGASESSRVRQDVALRSELSEADRQEQSARDEIAKGIVEAGYTRDAGLASWLADLYVAQANAERATAKDAYDAQSDAYKTRTDLLQQLFENYLAQKEYDQKEEERGGKTSTSKSSGGAKAAAGAKGFPFSPFDAMKLALGNGGAAMKMTK